MVNVKPGTNANMYGLGSSGTSNLSKSAKSKIANTYKLDTSCSDSLRARSSSGPVWVAAARSRKPMESNRDYTAARAYLNRNAGNTERVYADTNTKFSGIQQPKPTALDYMNFGLGVAGIANNVFGALNAQLDGSSNNREFTTPEQKPKVSLGNASGIKSALKSAKTTEDVKTAQKAYDQMKSKIESTVSGIDLKGSLSSSLDADAMNKLADFGIKIDLSSLDKISSDKVDADTVEAELKDMKEVSGSLNKAGESLTKTLGEQQGLLKNAVKSISDETAQLNILKSANPQDPAAIANAEKRLAAATKQKDEAEKKIAEINEVLPKLKDSIAVCAEAIGEMQSAKTSLETLKGFEEEAKTKTDELVKKEDADLGKINTKIADLEKKIKDAMKKDKNFDSYDKKDKKIDNKIGGYIAELKALSAEQNELINLVDTNGKEKKNLAAGKAIQARLQTVFADNREQETVIDGVKMPGANDLPEDTYLKDNAPIQINSSEFAGIENSNLDMTLADTGNRKLNPIESKAQAPTNVTKEVKGVLESIKNGITYGINGAAAKNSGVRNTLENLGIEYKNGEYRVSVRQSDGTFTDGGVISESEVIRMISTALA